MCIERVPTSNFAGSGAFTSPDIQVEPADVDTDYDDEYDFDQDYFNDGSNVSEWNDYMWMENEQEFEQEEIRRLEEEELANQCMEAMSEMLLLDEIRQVEAEQHKEIFLSDIAQISNLNPFAEEFFPAEPVATYT